MLSDLGSTTVIFFGLIVLWLAVVSFFLFKTVMHYNNLTKGVLKRNLANILEKILANYENNGKKISEIDTRLRKQEYEGNFKIQKLALTRFNPFADTGGEQSFIVSLLDNENSGLVMTSLPGRSGTRWYVKIVKKGKGVEFDLSKEEEETIKKAKPLS